MFTDDPDSQRLAELLFDFKKHRSQAAFPRLVVDNSSSSESSIPASRASLSSGKCHFPGTPRSGQFRTADSEMPSDRATLAAPPNRWSKEATSDIDNRLSRFGTTCNPEMRQPCLRLVEGRKMTPENGEFTIWDMAQAKSRVSPNQRRPRGSVDYPWADLGARLKEAREALTSDSAEAFAKKLKIKGQTYRNYERGARKLNYDTIDKIAKEGISLNWLFQNVKPMLITKDDCTSRKAAV